MSLAISIGLCLAVAVGIGVASAGARKASSKASTHRTTKTSFATITHTCTGTSSGGGMAGNDADNDGDTITFEGPTVLWPPNHKYVTEKITATDVDGSAETASDTDGVTLTTVASSSQPETGMGSGNTIEDAKVGTPTNGSESATQEVQLRAERDGVDPTKAGRTYTIMAMATFDNNSAETCNATFTVHVPHDQHHL